MRDQVQGLNRKGIKAKFVNSEQTPEENAQTIEEAFNGNLQILKGKPLMFSHKSRTLQTQKTLFD